MPLLAAVGCAGRAPRCRKRRQRQPRRPQSVAHQHVLSVRYMGLSVDLLVVQGGDTWQSLALDELQRRAAAGADVRDLHSMTQMQS